MATLSEYLLTTRRYIRDAQAVYWSDAELTAYINQAMKQRDTDSDMNRSIQTVTLTIGQNMYTINTGSFNPNTVNVLDIVVLIANSRYRLSERVYGEASSFYQPTTTWTGWPSVFAKVGATQVYLAPAPQQAYSTEWDTSIVSTDLASASDADPLPYPWTDPVPMLAAHYARWSLQQYDEAEKMKEAYMTRMAEIAGGIRGSMVQFPYSMSRNRV